MTLELDWMAICSTLTVEMSIGCENVSTRAAKLPFMLRLNDAS